jgi:hypothetical protein
MAKESGLRLTEDAFVPADLRVSAAALSLIAVPSGYQQGITSGCDALMKRMTLISNSDNLPLFADEIGAPSEVHGN